MFLMIFYAFQQDLMYAVVKGDVGSWWLDHRSAGARLEGAIRDGLRVFVVSHGGAGTWSFCNYLRDRKVQQTWLGTAHGLIHFPRPIAVRPSHAKRLLSAVYIFDDPLIAICSMKNRSFHHNVYSYLRERKIHLRSDIDLELLDLMFAQFAAWTHPDVASQTGYPVVWLRYEDAFDDFCLKSMCKWLGTCHRPGRDTASVEKKGGLALLDRPAAPPLSLSRFQTQYRAPPKVLIKAPLKSQVKHQGPEKRERHTTLESPCVVALEKRLDDERLLKVQEMRQFQGCQYKMP